MSGRLKQAHYHSTYVKFKSVRTNQQEEKSVMFTSEGEGTVGTGRNIYILVWEEPCGCIIKNASMYILRLHDFAHFLWAFYVSIRNTIQQKEPISKEYLVFLGSMWPPPVAHSQYLAYWAGWKRAYSWWGPPIYSKSPASGSVTGYDLRITALAYNTH